MGKGRIVTILSNYVKDCDDVNQFNQIEYSFYEKPMVSNRCLQADTALNHNCLVRSLSNEVMRRLDSFSPGMPISEKVAALDTFSRNL